jgi:hypothetical protein
MKTKPVIPPSTGRRVLVFMSTQPAGVTPFDKKKPYDAGIAYVWGDTDPVKNTINVGFADHGGNAHSATSVQLYDRPQDENDSHGRTDLGNYAVWMPYQFEQALRALQPKPAPGMHRPGDVELVKLADGDRLTEAGREQVNAELNEQEGDGGVLEGANRTTSGAIGQP